MGDPLSDANADDFSWCVDAEALAAAPTEAPPARLGTYRLGRCLGRGAGGAVYLARCTSLDRGVALKVLRAGDSEDVARFLGEARAVARLRHPNIVAIHEVGCDLGRWFIAFELVRGETLARRIDVAGRLEPREAARLAQRLARALDYAHGRGLLHRDVKPANVVMAPGGEPLLTDFGLVKDLRAKDGGLTLQGDVLGTPSYMAPEQARAEALDARCDIYSLGATLHEMLSGAPPFSGPAVQVLAAVLSEPPAPLPPLARDDSPLAAIVARCLEKDRARRYASAVELARDLERFLAGDPIAAAASTRLPALGQRRRVRRALAVGACAVGFAGLIAGLVATPEGDRAGVAAAGSAVVTPGAPRVALEPDGAREGPGAARGGGAETSAGDAPRDGARPRAPRVALAPPAAGDGGGPGPDGRRPPGGVGRRGGFAELPGAPPPAGIDDVEGNDLDRDALRGGVVAARDRQARSRTADEVGAEEDVASVETATPGALAPDPGGAAPATTPTGTTPTTPAPDQNEDDHDDDDDDDDDDREDDDYLQVLQPTFDPDGYAWDSYYQANSAPQGYVSTLQPLPTGDLIVAAVPARIDGIPPDEGAARVEASPPSPVSTTASVGGITFAATGDPAVAGAGDVYARSASGTSGSSGSSGSWTLAFDGPRREARVVSLGPTLYAISGDAQEGALVHARDAITGGWLQVADLGRCVPGAVVAYDGEVWVGAREVEAGERARLFRGAGGAWRELREAFDGREPSSGERQEVTALLAVDRFLFAAVATFDPGGAPAFGQVMALGKERLKKVVDLSLDAPLALAYVDKTLFVGTRRGRLLVLDRAGSSLELRPVADLPANAGVFTLLARDARTLLVGVQGPYGAEVLRRTAR